MIAVALVLNRAGDLLPPGLWWQAAFTPILDPRELLFHDSFLPRIAISLIAGAGLGLAGTIFQQVLRNPLAEPATLGVSAGAQFALASAMLWSPMLYGAAQGWIALAGAAGAFVIVVLLANAMGFSAVSLVVSGLMVSLVCGSVTAVLIVLDHDYLSALFLWQSGSLAQNGWSAALRLLLETIGMAVLCGVLMRPLDMMGLQDEGARSLGVSVRTIRAVLLALAVATSAFVTSAVGLIGFIGLAGPTLARGLGARSLRQRLLWAPLLGAGLLALTDQAVQTLTVLPQEIPTGAATGLLGAPFLLWLLPRLRPSLPAQAEGCVATRLPSAATRRMLVGGIVILLAVIVAALAIGRMKDGWHIATWPEIQALARWRAPRTIAAASCGALLAGAGVLLQRLTGNPAASPEITGISSGATVAVIVTMLLIPGLDLGGAWPAAGLGACLTLVLLIAAGRRATFSPERMLLTGMALVSLMAALSSIALASGDPRTSTLIGWMSGSTYGVTANEAVLAAVVAAVSIAVTPLAMRWLDILPLGAAGARSVGVNVRLASSVILVLAGVMTAAGTLIIGPLSFVGLIAPQLVRMAGIQRPLPHFLGAALAGALTMIIADWVGRTILSPWEIPAGLVASLIGFPCFFWSMRRLRA